MVIFRAICIKEIVSNDFHVLRMPRKPVPKSLEEVSEKYNNKVKEALQDLHHGVHESAEKKETLDVTLGG